jgi:hypothetical protein
MASSTPDPEAPDPVTPDAGPTDGSDPYVVRADYESTMAAARVAKRESDRKMRNREAVPGAVKPPSLPTDTYVVVPAGVEEPGVQPAPASTPPLATSPASTAPLATAPAPASAPSAPTARLSAAAASADAPTERIRGGNSQGVPPASTREPPTKRSNRPLGILVAVLATVLFAVLYAFAVLVIVRTVSGVAHMQDLANPGYWLPVLLFLLSFLVVVAVLNRAGWWAYAVGSLAVAAIVYFGSALFIGLIEQLVLGNPVTGFDALASAPLIVAAFLAREVALWAGAIIGARGRSLSARYSRDRAEFEAASH